MENQNLNTGVKEVEMISGVDIDQETYDFDKIVENPFQDLDQELLELIKYMP